MTTATLVSVRQLIRERLAAADEPDPHVVAAQIAEDADDEMARDALREALVGLVRQQIHENRARRPSAARAGKWGEYAAVLNTVFDQTYSVGPNKWKFLGDFTREDALYVAAGYEARAAAERAHAERFAALARKLKRGQTARDLDLDVVEGILYA